MAGNPFGLKCFLSRLGHIYSRWSPLGIPSCMLRERGLGRGRGDSLSDSGNDTEGRNKPLPVAVALAHDFADQRPPKVVAGGRGRIAEQILEIAFAHGVKVREDADLAQLLSSIDVDSEIPPEAFAAVAEILIYVYQANNAHRPGADGTPPGDGGLSTLWSEDPKP
jgi:flagellar biosynthesis protein